MTNQPVLRARTTPATAPVPASEADAQLSVELRKAQFIAKAGDAVPRSYRGNPGAVLLAMEWADRRGMDLMTAIQNVSFYEGKPLVDATMQRSLAEREGYQLTVEGDAQSATVTVTKPNGQSDSASFTIEEAEKADLLKKPVWQKYPGDMLVARATARALRRFAPAVVAGLREPDEAMDVEDPVAVLTENAGGDQDPETVDVAHNPVGESEEPSASTAAPESSPAPDDIPDAEVVEDKAEALQLLATLVKSLAPAQRDAFTAYGAAQGWPEKRSEMSGDELSDAIIWIERHA